MKLFFISLLLTLSEYNFYTLNKINYIVYPNNTVVCQKVVRYDPSVVSLVTISNLLILNKLDIIYQTNIYNLKIILYLLNEKPIYIDDTVMFINNICFVLIALNIL